LTPGFRTASERGLAATPGHNIDAFERAGNLQFTGIGFPDAQEQRMKSNSPMTRLALLSLLVAVGGCGGGGDGSAAASPTPSPTPSTSPVPAPPAGPNDAAHALVTNPPPTSYASGGAQAGIYAVLENARLGAGVGGLAENTQLDQMAANHLSYMAQNNTFGHTETAGQPGFTGAMPADRAKAVGYDYGSLGEVISESSVDDAPGCLRNLLDTVYHQALLMGSFREVGIAYGRIGSGNFGCVLDLGYTLGLSGQLPNGGVVSPYPYDTQTGVATTFVPSTEGPNPMPDYGGNPAGQPILASMVNYDSRGLSSPASFTVTQFVLKDSAGNAVPARLIAATGTGAGAGVTITADPASDLSAGLIYLVPLSPLAGATRYTVQFSGTAGGEALSRTWSFTTQ
jgi:uncharacterized protein YkwD